MPETSRKNRRQIETESVDVHFLNPIPQAVDDQPPNDRLIGVERVAATGVVGVSRSAVFQNVIRRIVDAAEAKSSGRLIAFRRVVVDDVENDFDAGSVQAFDHVAKFVDRPERRLPGTELGAERKTTPARSPSNLRFPGDNRGVELEHRQQFDGRDAKLLQIGDLFDQPGVGSPFSTALDARTGMPRESSHVHFVDDRAGRERRSGWSPSQS